MGDADHRVRGTVGRSVHQPSARRGAGDPARRSPRIGQVHTAPLDRIAADALVVDLDDHSMLRLVREDPGSALASPGLMPIDEFHRAPEVLSYVKRVVDRQGGTARFLLAGSVNSFLLPPGTETLTGRAHRLSLPPLAAAEIMGSKRRWLAELLNDREPRNFRTTRERSDVFDMVAAGGYPSGTPAGDVSATNPLVCELPGDRDRPRPAGPHRRPPLRGIVTALPAHRPTNLLDGGQHRATPSAPGHATHFGVVPASPRARRCRSRRCR